MKLQALRVRGVGPFAAGAAVEGLSGGLDVLIGPNEAGKSTLFGALETVFYNSYASGAGFIAKVASAADVNPLIEVDFSVDAVAWRLTKQFSAKSGKSRFAKLAALNGSQATLSDEAAEDKLARLIGLEGGKAGRLGFLWVGQGEGLKPWSLDTRTKDKDVLGQKSALSAALEREVAAVTGSSVLSGVRELIAQELAPLKTPAKMQPRTGGSWEQAVKRHNDLLVQLEAATRARDQSELRRTELATLNARLEVIGSREALAVEAEAIVTTQQRFEKALGDRRLFEAAEQRARDAEGARSALASKLDALQSDIAAVERLDGETAAAGPRLSALIHELERERGAAQACEAAIAQLRGALAQADRLVVLRAQRQAALGARAQFDEQVVRLAQGQVLAAEVERLRGALARGGVSDAELDGVVAAEAALTRAVDALAAGAPRIEIAYVPGAEGAIRIDGVGAREGLQAVTDGAVVLEIAGVGQITVSPGAGSDRAALLVARDAARGGLGQWFSRLGASDVDEVRKRHGETRALQGQLDEARARLKGLAPQGLEALSRAVEAGRATLAGLTVADASADEDSVIAGISLRQTELVAEEARAKALRAQLVQLTGDVAREEANGQHRGSQLSELLQRLPPREHWGNVRADLAKRLEDAREAAAQTLRAVAALGEGLVSAAECVRLEGDIAVLRERQGSRAREIGRLEVQRGQLVGAENAADEQGLASQVQALQGACERASGDASRQRAHVEALVLLDSVLDGIERDNQERFLAPVSAHVAPFMDIMFPAGAEGAARLGFDKDLAVVGLQRGAAGLETLGQLSGGTQEQISVLVRLGFGRLLARAGHAAPVILDDALVYCDDERIIRVFRALELAAVDHQVVVLSCRERSFAQLGGHRVHVTPWLD